MQLYTFIGAALVALLVTLLPALAHKQHRNLIREEWRYPLRLMFGVLTSELGTASILYTTPELGTPTATAITAAVASKVVAQVAQVTFADGDLTIPFVHNWGGIMPASFPTWGFPEIQYYWLSQNASPTSFQTALTFGIANTNQVTINKTSVGTGSGGVVQVILRLPHSMGR